MCTSRANTCRAAPWVIAVHERARHIATVQFDDRAIQVVAQVQIPHLVRRQKGPCLLTLHLAQMFGTRHEFHRPGRGWKPPKDGLIVLWPTNGRVSTFCGLPIRDCAKGCTNRGQSRPVMSAIDVTAKTLFERLYLVLGMGTFGQSTFTMHPQLRLFTYNYFSIFVKKFPPNGLSFFLSSRRGLPLRGLRSQYVWGHVPVFSSVVLVLNTCEGMCHIWKNIWKTRELWLRTPSRAE